jgi:hypothetical protein
MRFGINLRGDLAKLSDTEIAAVFDELLMQRQKVNGSISDTWDGANWQYNIGPWAWFGRGPLHARIFLQIGSTSLWAIQDQLRCASPPGL